MLLLIEDDPALREALAEILRAEGYEVACASDGEEGLALLHELRPQAIITDLMMPKLTGWGFRRHREARAVPTLVLTAITLSEAEREALGCEVLVKPVKVRELLAWVGRQAK